MRQICQIYITVTFFKHVMQKRSLWKLIHLIRSFRCEVGENPTKLFIKKRTSLK